MDRCSVKYLDKWRTKLPIRFCLSTLVAWAIILLGLDSAFSATHAGTYTIAAGQLRSSVLLPNFHAPETRADGTNYRWSRAESTIVLGPIGGQAALVTLRLGGRPAPATLRLSLAGAPFTTLEATIAPRRYQLLVPTTPQPETRITIASPLFTAPGDQRELGFILDAVHIQRLNAPFYLPPLALFILQLATLTGLALCLWRIRLRWLAPPLLLIAILLASTWVWLLPSAFSYLQRLAVATWLLVGATWLVLPWLEQLPWLTGPTEARTLWGITLGAIGIRLIGVLYPPFAGQDLGYHHLPRLAQVIAGGLIIIAPSSEFGGGLILNPPGLYLLLMPGLLLTTDTVGIVQGSLGLLDGGTALLVGLLARRLGGGRTTGQLAALLYAANLGSFAAHFFGFYPQIFGQWLTAPIALLLMTEGLSVQRRWLSASLLLLIATLTHIGVAILGFTWLTWSWLLTVVSERRWQWRRLISIPLLLAGTGLIAILCLYADYLPIVLSRPLSGALTPKTTWLPGATPLLLRGMTLALYPIGLVLLPLGVLLVIQPSGWKTRNAIALAGVLTTIMYLCVDLLTAYQVRYFYFVLPLALPLITLPLGRIAHRGRFARTVIWVLTALLCLQGAILWLSATLGEGRISLTPLTH